MKPTKDNGAHGYTEAANYTTEEQFKKEEIYLDLSKLSEEEIENIYNTVKETGFIKPNFYTDKDFMMLKFCTIEERWGCSGKNWDGLKHKTELTYPEFIKLFEGGEESQKYDLEALAEDSVSEVTPEHGDYRFRGVYKEFFKEGFKKAMELNSNQ